MHVTTRIKKRTADREATFTSEQPLPADRSAYHHPDLAPGSDLPGRERHLFVAPTRDMTTSGGETSRRRKKRKQKSARKYHPAGGVEPGQE
ncbi:hypothetical protein NQ315_005027 [Exocentrus adspersus]|uniref:Uncharacterized protein n=1 Tax=Exocentrus adspersus TaxID=1586481 RepID=A0AAV8VQQ8_9CUCU|nr:hypothetical protein NQ315_005027 [Exocentrus adspersus]